jgi:uncharacterized membrane protein YvbJ
MKKCKHCGAQNEDDNLFCTECGNELPKGMVCPNCGTFLDVGDTFCSNCGKKIDGKRLNLHSFCDTMLFEMMTVPRPGAAP